MKRFIVISILVTMIASRATAHVVTERCRHSENMQLSDLRHDFGRSYNLLSDKDRPKASKVSRMYSLTELQYGFGLRIVEPPFAHHVTGATTVIGVSFPGGFTLGGGAGFLKYNGGYTIPLYADIRYYMGSRKVKFFVAMPAGFLFNFDNFRDYSRIFGNPSVGVTVPFLKSTQLSFSTGLFTQIDREIFDDPSFDAPWHDSFINLKLGLLFGW